MLLAGISLNSQPAAPFCALCFKAVLPVFTKRPQKKKQTNQPTTKKNLSQQSVHSRDVLASVAAVWGSLSAGCPSSPLLVAWPLFALSPPLIGNQPSLLADKGSPMAELLTKTNRRYNNRFTGKVCNPRGGNLPDPVEVVAPTGCICSSSRQEQSVLRRLRVTPTITTL